VSWNLDRADHASLAQLHPRDYDLAKTMSLIYGWGVRDNAR
jgi:antitoxin YefM